MISDNKIGWMVFCIAEFARRKSISIKAAFKYLYQLGGIKFLDKYYEAEHLLSFDDTVDDLILVCEDKEGVSQ
jgi:hypothetical protein